MTIENIFIMLVPLFIFLAIAVHFFRSSVFIVFTTIIIIGVGIVITSDIFEILSNSTIELQGGYNTNTINNIPIVVEPQPVNKTEEDQPPTSLKEATSAYIKNYYTK